MPRNGTNGVSNKEDSDNATRFIGNNIVKLSSINNHQLFIRYFLSVTIEIIEYIQITVLLIMLTNVWLTTVSIGVRTIKNDNNSYYWEISRASSKIMQESYRSVNMYLCAL